MFSQINVNAPRLLPIAENVTPSAPFEGLPLEVNNELAYLQAREYGTVGAKIETPAEKAQARKTVEAAFGEDYVRTISELRLDDEFDQYTKSGAFRCVTFLDWYTLRDYKQAGYMRVNRPLKNLHDAGHAEPGAAGSPLSEQAQMLATRLADAIDKAGSFQQREIQAGPTGQSDQLVYSGTDMSRAALRNLEPGSIYEYPAFLSTTTDESVADEFCRLPDERDSGRAAVLYEIELSPESRALDISKIWNDGEEEILFPLKTKFVVQQIREVGGVFKVALSELSESHSDTGSELSVDTSSSDVSRFGMSSIMHTSNPTRAEGSDIHQAGATAPQRSAGPSVDFETELAQMGVDLDFIISRPVDENIKPEYFGFRLDDGESYRMAHTAAVAELQDAVDAAFHAPIKKFRAELGKLDHRHLLAQLAPDAKDWLYSSLLRKVPRRAFPILSKMFAEKLLTLLENDKSADTADRIINVLLRFPKNALAKAIFGVTSAIGLTAESRGVYRKIVSRGDVETQALMYRLSVGLTQYAHGKNQEKQPRFLAMSKTLR